ncbi:MAG: hypothetical protein L6408_08530 [Nanoarchaeota archaeon]|nr:hypothetical protein [Nanoarchaeota archaeon]
MKKEFSEETEFINLVKLLKEDNLKVKRIKSLFKKEEKYNGFLGAIEYTIAEHFITNWKIKDKDIVKTIKNIKRNYTKDLDFFQNEFEKDIMKKLSYVLQEQRITHHELILVLNYILWCIDNRTWMQDKQAYVKWITYFFKLFDDKEMKKYEESVKKFAKKIGIPKKHVESMLLKNSDNILEHKEQENSRIESEFFSLEDSDKFDFVIKHALENPYLIGIYSEELDEKKDYKNAKKFYKKLLEIIPEFPPIEISLGILYKKTGDTNLAKHYLENALNTIEQIPQKIIPKEQKQQLVKEAKRELKSIK